MTDKLLREALEWYASPAAWTMEQLEGAHGDYGARARAALAAAPQPAPSYEDLLDKIDGLESDLDNAVEVAIKRGAVEWGRLNYPNHPALKAAPQPAPDREALVEVIDNALRDWSNLPPLTCLRASYVADALLARGLRLPGPDQSDA